MLLNCGVGEISWESLGLEGDPTSPFWRRSVLGVHWKDWCWSWNSNTLATWCKELTLWKDPDAGKDWGQEEKGTAEDEMAGWHHWLNGHGFGWTPGVGDGQGGLACCDSWGRKESDMTERLNWLSVPLNEYTAAIINSPVDKYSDFFHSGGCNKKCCYKLLCTSLWFSVALGKYVKVYFLDYMVRVYFISFKSLPVL